MKLSKKIYERIVTYSNKFIKGMVADNIGIGNKNDRNLY